MDRPRSLLSPDTGAWKTHGPRAELRPRLGPGSLLSGGPHRVEELADFQLEAVAVAGQLFNGAADFPDRVDRLLRRRLDAGNLLADLACSLGGLLGQRLYFGGHNRKAAAGLTGACRLDGGIQRQ